MHRTTRVKCRWNVHLFANSSFTDSNQIYFGSFTWFCLFTVPFEFLKNNISKQGKYDYDYEFLHAFSTFGLNPQSSYKTWRNYINNGNESTFRIKFNLFLQAKTFVHVYKHTFCALIKVNSKFIFQTFWCSVSRGKIPP